jgi:DNA-binding IclR family transcriptional regulator
VKPRRGIQSIEVGGKLLLALVERGKPMVLRDLAGQAGMPPAKAHPYLVSFGNLGLVKQDPVTGHYELGPLALQLGLVSLQRLEPVKEAVPEVVSLVEKTGHTVFVSVWGNLGPTIVRIEESSHPIHVNLRMGTVLSLVETATGCVFAAFLPPKQIERILQDQLVRLPGGGASPKQATKLLEQSASEVRRRGIARSVGRPIPGVNAVSAPVFDAAGNIVLAITAMGPVGVFDPSWNGEVAKALREAASAVSARIGYSPTVAQSDSKIAARPEAATSVK